MIADILKNCGVLEPDNFHSQWRLGRRYIPEIFKKYIQEIFNPKGNGNCGYRCLAKVLGYVDNGWFQVQEEISKEAESN
ncbi:hypothetical protein KEM48_009723 [Puccinia striiformis f. sp. tritici PST-130]|uniref:OTU domain-containing protein n=1 Tax=Puccinia striiformis f. sp. tritici PST-78 TaxID=1165861 RepID=A0A0L0VUB1_9BASI|nr:hypothetical protein H4Q26_010084 [Puccinia striiformis f. sp. tritici PST-130]KAI9623103.1 hypothetical protein KEM48_009723 [Puccinia striiformis f. sp. tritici PST-130]KNF02570.1 hypothetical protein PSTG_04169 [Puccinia striiformis f. sp. tritici PST-78]